MQSVTDFSQLHIGISLQNSVLSASLKGYYMNEAGVEEMIPFETLQVIKESKNFT